MSKESNLQSEYENFEWEEPDAEPYPEPVEKPPEPPAETIPEEPELDPIRIYCSGCGDFLEAKTREDLDRRADLSGWSGLVNNKTQQVVGFACGKCNEFLGVNHVQG